MSSGKVTVSELRARIQELGIKLPSGYIKKDDLIAILNGSTSSVGTSVSSSSDLDQLTVKELHRIIMQNRSMVSESRIPTKRTELKEIIGRYNLPTTLPQSKSVVPRQAIPIRSSVVVPRQAIPIHSPAVVSRSEQHTIDTPVENKREMLEIAVCLERSEMMSSYSMPEKTLESLMNLILEDEDVEHIANMFLECDLTKDEYYNTIILAIDNEYRSIISYLKAKNPSNPKLLEAIFEYDAKYNTIVL